MFFNLLEDAANTGSPVTTYIIMGVLVVAIIGLFVWQTISGKKKQKEAQEMVNSIKKGDRIKTIGGICGFLVEVRESDNTIVIETGTDENKSYIRLVREAIYQTGPANPQAPVVEAKAEEVPAEAKVEEVATIEEVVETEVKPAKKKTAKAKKQAPVAEAPAEDKE